MKLRSKKKENLSKAGIKEQKNETVSSSETDINRKIEEKLLERVPQKREIHSPVNSPDTYVNTEGKISQANKEAENIVQDAKMAIVHNYLLNETERAKRQKPLLVAIVVFTGLQLLVFNCIICGVCIAAFKSHDSVIVSDFFDILKYYIGATIVELIGMLWFITKGTFSSDHVKVMEYVLKDKDTNDKNKS